MGNHILKKLGPNFVIDFDQSNYHSRNVPLPPLFPVAPSPGSGVVIVVPTFAKCDQVGNPTIAAFVSACMCSITVAMCDHNNCTAGMQAQAGRNTVSKNHSKDAAAGKQCNNIGSNDPMVVFVQSALKSVSTQISHQFGV
jgi:hypothetical protein